MSFKVLQGNMVLGALTISLLLSGIAYGERAKPAELKTRQTVLDPNHLTLKDLEKTFEEPGTQRPNDTRNSTIFGWLCDSNDASKACGVEAEFIIGDDGTSDSTVAVKVDVSKGFNGYVRGVRLGDLVKKVIDIGRRAGYAPMTDGDCDGRIQLDNTWLMSWWCGPDRRLARAHIAALSLVNRHYCRSLAGVGCPASPNGPPMEE